MRKWLVILLCLPLFIFSQEERKYEKTMSFSQFAKELKEAADKGIGYTLEDHYITYDSIRDQEHILYTDTEWLSGKIKKTFVGDMQIKGISFNKSTKVKIANCKFGESEKHWTTTLTFKGCSFDTLFLTDNDIGSIIIDTSNITYLSYISISKWLKQETKEKLSERHNLNLYSSSVQIKKSKIKVVNCSGNSIDNIVRDEFPLSFYMNSSEVGGLYCKSFYNIDITKNTIGTCFIGNRLYTLDNERFVTIRAYIKDNVFGDFGKFKNNVTQINTYLSDKEKTIKMQRQFSGSELRINIGIKNLFIYNNTFLPQEKIAQDSILQNLLSYHQENGKIYSRVEDWNTENRFIRNDYINIRNHKDTLEIEDGVYYYDSISFKQKFKLLEKFIKEYKIQPEYKLEGIRIINGDFNNLRIKNNNTPYLNIRNANIESQFEVINNTVDSLIEFKNNTLPDFNKVIIDSSFTKKIGFYHSEKVSFGVSMPKDLDSTNTEKYNKNIQNLITSFRQIISIMNLKGDDIKTALIVRLKDIETNKKCLIYHQNPNIENWFNWQGSQFIKWYSDYGMNPFKALAYCFWAMLYFAMFYFIFYNDWDKIDRSFLIKRFNSVMDYFTTEKRIEDFYATMHNKEMTTFTEFKDTLDKNKVYMPTMLASLAKPIYHISLLRYKLLSFSYKKAEFMAGRKWVDLEKKEKYWIGALTFFLTLTYIIYLVFIRSLNSIVLSINAFSTLGFGQIPVRGFTKYVAIIEGFIGWFMLSIFLVSVLSQMMSI